MEKELLTIKGNRKVLFPDALFLYIEWKGNANPKKDEELADIIDDLDTEYFPSNKKESIAQRLPVDRLRSDGCRKLGTGALF